MPGPAGDDQHLAGEPGPDRLALLAGEGERLALLEPVERAVHVDLQGQGRLDQQGADARRHARLGRMEGSEEHRPILGAVQRLEDDLLHVGQGHQGLLHQSGGRFEELLRFLDQGLARQVDVPPVRALAQEVKRAGLDALRRRGRDAQVLGDLVRRLEADAVDVRRQAVGILPYQPGGLGAVGLVDFDGVVGGDAVGLEEDHDFFDLPLLLPGAEDLLPAFGADPFHLDKPLGAVLDHVESLQTEGSHQTRSHHLADSGDEPGAQVLLDAADSRRHHRGVGGDPELPAVLRVVDPGSGQAQVLPRLHPQQVADGRHQIAVPLHGQARHRPGILLVGEDDPLQHPFQGGGVAVGRVEGESHVFRRLECMTDGVIFCRTRPPPPSVPKWPAHA